MIVAKADRGAHYLTLAVFAIFWLAGCAIRPITPALTHFDPDTAGYRWDPQRVLPNNDPQTILILTFSGGGTRAAAFSFGVLEELRRTIVHAPGRPHPMLDEVDLMTGVSGGSFTALAYSLYGERLFDIYEDAFLRRDVEAELLRRLFNPFTGHSLWTRRIRALRSRRGVLRRDPLPRRNLWRSAWANRRRGRWPGRPT